MWGFVQAHASRNRHAKAPLILVALTIVACAKGAGGPGSTEGAGGGTVITGAGGDNTTSSGPTGTASGDPASSSSGVGASTSSSSGSGGACAESPCKLAAPQCGCPAGQECNLNASNMRACIQAGTAGLNQLCSTATDCAPGLICLNASPTANACGQFCEADGECSGGLCIVSLSDGSGNTIPNVTLCSTTCNPITNANCTIGGSGCKVGQEQTGAMRWFTSCYPAGNGGQGSPCSSSADCAPRTWCITSSTQGNICSTYCNVNAPSCPGGTSCSGVQDQNMNPIVVNGVTYGACL
jgi:hypothetical protein